MKYMKVMFGTTSGADSNLNYKIGEVNETSNWNPCADNPKEMGGFNFSTEDKIIRWLVRGDTLYDVLIPDDAEVVECESASAPHGVFRSNKIILTNPRKITDDMALDLYKKSNLPEKSYFKTLAGCVIRNRLKTADLILQEKVNINNVEVAISEYKDFYCPNAEDDKTGYDNFYKYLQKLESIKNQK